MPLLIDLGDLPDECCSGMLDELAKAWQPSHDAIMAEPVPSRFARAYVETITTRLHAIVEEIRQALLRFLSGKQSELRKSDEPWLRMEGARFEATRVYLESKTLETMTFDDFRLLVSWLLERYLPDGVITTEAEFIAVVGSLMGKIQANLEADHRVNDPLVTTIESIVPTTLAAVPIHALTPVELSVLNYAKAHAAEYIRDVTEQTRHRLAGIILEHQQAAVFGQREGGWKYLATRLFDEFSHLNKDMRRIAITEGGECVNQGYIAAKPSGQKVKRIEAYTNACAFCKSINGIVLEVVEPDAPNKDGWKQVWSGKSNYGRSASPHKRQGDVLIGRDESELWWPAAGVMHPSCRGAWLPVTERPPDVSVEFFQLLQSILDRAT